MKICVDVDETICFYKNPDDRVEYNNPTPHMTNISKINDLFDLGHTIIYWTARGSRSGIDWTELTAKQLNKWGAKYHQLRCDKPYYDLLIDDKSIKIEQL